MRIPMLLGFCLVWGCSQPELKPDPPVPTRDAPDSRRDVIWGVRTASLNGGWYSVAPGETLVSGTELSLRVTVPAPSYAFIGHRIGSGAIEVIYPAASAPPLRVEPGQPLLVPGPGKWLTLDERTGEEALFLVSQPTPEHDAAQQLFKERGEASCVKTRDPPPPDVKIRDRGFSVRGPIDDAGIAVLCLPFHHR